jgi:phage tail tube protein FII
MDGWILINKFGEIERERERGRESMTACFNKDDTEHNHTIYSQIVQHTEVTSHTYITKEKSTVISLIVCCYAELNSSASAAMQTAVK